MIPLMLITGGIGSGKSFVSNVFSAMGIPIYNTDKRTKELYIENSELQTELKGLLGDDVIVDGKLNKEYMAARLFVKSDMMGRLEDLVYPYLLEDIKCWQRVQRSSGAPFLILESAILLEKPLFNEIYDKVLTVRAPMELRISRTMARNNISRESVQSRIAKQWSDERRIALSDYVIESDSVRAILPQVVRVYEDLKNSIK